MQYIFSPELEFVLAPHVLAMEVDDSGMRQAGAEDWRAEMSEGEE